MNKIPIEVWKMLGAAAIKGIEVLKERVSKRGLIMKFRSQTDQRLVDLETRQLEHAKILKSITDAMAAESSGDPELIASFVSNVNLSQEEGNQVTA